MTRDEALEQAGRDLELYKSCRYTLAEALEYAQALIAYAAELRQTPRDSETGLPVDSQGPTSVPEPLRVGVCVCGQDWWSDSKPYRDAKSGEAHHYSPVMSNAEPVNRDSAEVFP